MALMHSVVVSVVSRGHNPAGIQEMLVPPYRARAARFILKGFRCAKRNPSNSAPRSRSIRAFSQQVPSQPRAEMRHR